MHACSLDTMINLTNICNYSLYGIYNYSKIHICMLNIDTQLWFFADLATQVMFFIDLCATAHALFTTMLKAWGVKSLESSLPVKVAKV